MIFNNEHYIPIKNSKYNHRRDLVLPIYILVDKVIYDYLIEVNKLNVGNPESSINNLYLVEKSSNVLIDYSKFNNNKCDESSSPEIIFAEYFDESSAPAITFAEYFFKVYSLSSYRTRDASYTITQHPDYPGYLFYMLDFRKSNFGNDNENITYVQEVLDFTKSKLIDLVIEETDSDELSKDVEFFNMILTEPDTQLVEQTNEHIIVKYGDRYYNYDDKLKTAYEIVKIGVGPLKGTFIAKIK